MSSSFVVVGTETLTAASTDLTGIGTAVRAAHAAAAGSTTQIAVAAQDEVSAAVSQLFGTYAREYQAISAQATAFHDQFVQALANAGNAYALTEAASASPLQTLEDDILGVINAPTNFLFGRPLIGDGANATTPGGAGGPGGFLIGAGGVGAAGAPGTGSNPG
ncbi:PE family protein, partial [Mycobacterium sp. Marseille-P9652]|uniref:PE family protein n=1 Tax=Mycobacterium sp. Marseille-P9652 TaxID=2654950 RepID=UPI0012E7F508